MNQKTLLVIIVALSTSFTFVIVALLAVYRLEPTLLGYPPQKTDSLEIVKMAEQARLDSLENEKRKIDTIFVEPKIALSVDQIEGINRETLDKELLSSEKDKIREEKIELEDSLNKVYSSINGIRDSISIVLDSLKKRETYSGALNDSLNKYIALHKKAEAELNRLKELQKQKDSVAKEKILTEEDIENLQKFAKIYENSKPENVARILEQVDEKEASMILKFMNKKKAGKVLEAMEPEQAAAILLLGANE